MQAPCTCKLASWTPEARYTTCRLQPNMHMRNNAKKTVERMERLQTAAGRKGCARGRASSRGASVAAGQSSAETENNHQREAERGLQCARRR